MMPLIFPYTFHPSPVFEKTKADEILLSLISAGSVNVENRGFYQNIYVPSDSMLSKIENFYKYYTSLEDRTFLISETFRKKDEDSPYEIIKNLKSEKNTYELEDDNKILNSGVILKLFADYNIKQLEIESELLEINKKEKELFQSILKAEPFGEDVNKAIENTHELPFSFLINIIKSWLAIFIETGCDINLWLTDKKIYMELLEEIGMEFIESESIFLSVNKKKYRQFISKLSFGELLAERFFFIKNYNKENKIFGKKIRLIFP
ncbi:MAG: hypothetical protein CSB21_02990 [Deltaproteobacteria bacterium]|nr:MAG: hypothetical protein CSB21_02990 [Deltaproteobacteria bacterium]